MTNGPIWEHACVIDRVCFASEKPFLQLQTWAQGRRGKGGGGGDGDGGGLCRRPAIGDTGDRLSPGV
jgi:hypothetical protein